MDRYRILLKKKPPKVKPTLTSVPTKEDARRAKIYTDLVRIITDKLGGNSDIISPRSRFDDMGVDSLDAQELIIAVEELYKIDIPDDQAFRLRTVGDAVAMLVKIKEINPFPGA